MTVTIALLRGVNVGAKNRIRMADLKRVFESTGLLRVETFIQSGNVIFESEGDESSLQNAIEQALAENFNSSIAVVLRTAGDLERLIRGCPFSAQEIAAAESANTEGESLYVNLCRQAPAIDEIVRLNAYAGPDDAFAAADRDIYLLLRHSIRNSKLAVNLQKLSAPGTVRNWKTLHSLHELALARTPQY